MENELLLKVVLFEQKHPDPCYRSPTAGSIELQNQSVSVNYRLIITYSMWMNKYLFMSHISNT